ncbi:MULTISPECIES: hypothetical protein [Streptomyces]|nr:MULTISPECIES: hypothetical protein [Streptomyces]UUA04520.1 hypothetical protein NNW98_02840 [Streptomyces koelreuteriae]UUA12145.1 hypothetical protein NNW99_02840 [Streptomyces sp. CRCS-T-1]
MRHGVSSREVTAARAAMFVPTAPAPGAAERRNLPAVRRVAPE